MTDLSKLIERLKAATGADRELDWQIDSVLNLQYDFFTRPRFTASIDAALALCERLLPGCVWTIEANACWIRVLTKDDVAEFQGNKNGMGGGWTPLAILLALCTALQSKDETNVEGV